MPQGQVTNLTSAYQVYPITISGTTATIPDVTLASTTDSNVPNALYTAVLYTSTDRPVYTLLGNGFVDPEYFQSPPQSAVLLADAGTPSQNGTYTYRGITAGYPYYNLLGESDSTTLFAVVNDGATWLNTDSLGATQYISTGQADYPFDITWEVSAGAADAPTVSENANYVGGTWEQLILSNEASATAGMPFQWNSPFWNVQQTKEYVNSLVGAGTTPFASRVVVGKTALSQNPALSTLPIAVGDNDARVNTVNAAQYSSFSAAVDAVAGLPGAVNILEVSTAISTGAKTVPSDVILQFTNGGKLTATSGTVTIQGEIRAPAALCFVESGGTIDISGAKAENFYFEWYGITSGADNTTSLQWLIDQRKGVNSDYATTIRLMYGTNYSHASQLNWDDIWGMRVIGAGGQGYRSGNGFTYTGSGSTSAHTVKSSFGCTWENLRFKYTSATFTGFLVECGHSGVGADCQNLLFLNGGFTGTSTAYTAKALVCFEKTILSKIENSNFQYAQIGYQGIKTVAESGAYSVNNDLVKPIFNDCGIHVFNPGEALTVTRPCHEANFQSLGGVYRLGDCRFYDNEAAGPNPLGLSIIAPWGGDGATSASTYGAFTFRNVYGLTVQGGAITLPSGGAGTVTCFELHGCGGVDIGEGTRVAGGDYYGAYDTADSIGVKWSGDDQAVVNTIQSRNAAVGVKVSILGNYTKANIINGGLSVLSDVALTRSNVFGGIDLGYKDFAGSTNASAEFAVMDSSISGYTQGSLSLNAPYNGGDNPIYLSTYQGTTLTPRVRVSATEFRPETNDGQALGDTTHNWSDLFLASGSLVNVANGNWVMTHTSGIQTVTTGDLRVTTAGTNAASVVTVGGTQTLTAKTLTAPTISNPTVTTGSFTSPALTTPTIGVATGTSLAVTGLVTSSGTAGIGYATGAGGTQTQGTSRTTTVVLNKTCGAITLFSAAGSATPASFTVTNSTVAITDTVIVNQKSGTDKYATMVTAVGAGSFEITFWDLTGTTTEQPVFSYSVIKAVTA